MGRRGCEFRRLGCELLDLAGHQAGAYLGSSFEDPFARYGPVSGQQRRNSFPDGQALHELQFLLHGRFDVRRRQGLSRLRVRVWAPFVEVDLSLAIDSGLLGHWTAWVAGPII